MLQAIIVQFRLLAMLVSLEAKRRFGTGFSGIIGAFLEASMLIVIMVGMRLLTGATAHRGMEIAPFVVSGLIVLLAFRGCLQQSMGTPQAFNRLQSSTKITILDLDIARTIVVILIYTFIAVVFITILIAMGEAEPPENPLGNLWVIFLAGIFGLTVGQIIRSVLPAGFIRTILLLIFTRASIWLSGAFFVAPELPYAWRELMLYNPLLNLTEMSRTAYFAVYTSDYADEGYVAACLAALLITALVVERATRSRWSEA